MCCCRILSALPHALVELLRARATERVCVCVSKPRPRARRVALSPVRGHGCCAVGDAPSRMHDAAIASTARESAIEATNSVSASSSSSGSLASVRARLAASGTSVNSLLVLPLTGAWRAGIVAAPGSTSVCRRAGFVCRVCRRPIRCIACAPVVVVCKKKVRERTTVSGACLKKISYR